MNTFKIQKLEHFGEQKGFPGHLNFEARADLGVVEGGFEEMPNKDLLDGCFTTIGLLKPNWDRRIEVKVKRS